MRLTLRLGLVLAVFIGAAYVFAFPARTYIEQRHEIAVQEQTVSVLRAENAKLAAESSALQNTSTIEQIARQEYGLVMPGQQAFMVLPSTAPPATKVPKVAKARPWYAPLEFWHQF
ncbi:MAG TPA: septum formation initiator family protein [Acidimicrobiales bacterium]|nr:septum formation initiator family protein [Acidimicrobiales bacterium]